MTLSIDMTQTLFLLGALIFPYVLPIPAVPDISDDEGENTNEDDENTKPKEGDEDTIPEEDGENTKPSKKGKSLMYTASQNVSLQTNNSNFERGESSNSNNINQNLNFENFNNCGEISQEGSDQPSTSPQSSGIGFDYGLLFELLDMMKCPSRYHEFLGLLTCLNAFEASEREGSLLTLGTLLTIEDSYFLDLATNQNGSRALVALLNRTPSLDRLIFNSVHRHFSSLMNSRHGCCLIVPTIRAVDEPRKEILFELTYSHTFSLATEVNGCIALIDVLQEIKGRFRDLIFHLIAENAYWLCFDLCGRQVVLNLLSLQHRSATQEIAYNLFGTYFKLAKERQGSYVVEKCLKSEIGREIVLAEFRGNDEEWIRMANDEFGNLVAQCALREMKERGMTEMLNEFVEKLRPHFEKMKINRHGNNTLRVIEEIEESTEKLPVNILGFLP